MRTVEARDEERRSTNMRRQWHIRRRRSRRWEGRASSVQAMHPTKDKRARLRVAARYIKLGVVKFPRHGCEQLSTQGLGFGEEKHDDACDALVYLILGVIGDGIEEQNVHMA
jgi:predicted phage terminase large subunit-like protein